MTTTPSRATSTPCSSTSTCATRRSSATRWAAARSCATSRLAFLDDFLQTWFGTDPTSAARRGYAFQIAAFASPKATLDCLASIARTDFRADLGKVTIPTLLIHGDSDLGVPLELSSERVHDAVAGIELVVVEGAPHGLVLTHAEEFNRALLDFLER